MSEEIIVSAIIPTYNGEKHIRETIESVLRQTRVPDEIVISDDGSSDGTIPLVRELAACTDTPIKLVFASGSGISDNYFNAANHASGDVMVVGDHDDLWTENKVERVVSAFEQNADALLVCSDSLIVDEQLNESNTTLRGGRKKSENFARLSSEDNLKQYIKGLRFDAHTLAFKRELLPVAQSDAFSKYHTFWFENRMILACMSLADFVYLPEHLTLYRQHADQHTRQLPTDAENSAEANSSAEFTRIQEMQLLIASLKRQHGSRLINEQCRVKRIKRLTEYCYFLQARESAPISKLIGNMLAGRYHCFVRRGFLSFLKDMLRSLG